MQSVEVELDEVDPVVEAATVVLPDPLAPAAPTAPAVPTESSTAPTPTAAPTAAFLVQAVTRMGTL
jgi:hypothetical protein